MLEEGSPAGAAHTCHSPLWLWVQTALWQRPREWPWQVGLAPTGCGQHQGQWGTARRDQGGLGVGGRAAPIPHTPCCQGAAGMAQAMLPRGWDSPGRGPHVCALAAAKPDLGSVCRDSAVARGPGTLCHPDPQPSSASTGPTWWQLRTSDSAWRWSPACLTGLSRPEGHKRTPSLLRTDRWEGSQCPLGPKSQSDVCSLNTSRVPAPCSREHVPSLTLQQPWGAPYSPPPHCREEGGKEVRGSPRVPWGRASEPDWRA